MKSPILFAGSLALAFAFSLAQAPSYAQTTKNDPGKAEFEANCAACHGLGGKGDGPVVPALKNKPTDLTQLAKKNGGVLPVPQLVETIRGEKRIDAHGTADMPAWGRRFRVAAGEHYVDMPYDPEAYVRARILTLVEYINRLQAK